MPLGPFDPSEFMMPPPTVGPQVQPPMEDKQLLLSQLGFAGGGGMAGGAGSAGQPTGGGGKWQGGAGLAIAAPIVAALIGKMSGGKMGMGEALAGLGGGFLNSKLTQQKEKKAQTMDQENRMMDLAHKAVQGLDKISPESLAKFPKLQSLSQKYQEALANDGIISPKEAAEIVTAHQMAQADMAAAQQIQGDTNRDSDLRRQYQIQQEEQSRGKIQSFTDLLPNADGVSPEEKFDLGREIMGDNAMAEMERDTPQQFDVDGRQMSLKPTEYIAYKRAQETERHNLEIEKVRAAATAKAHSGQGRQEMLAQFQGDMATWKMELDTALAQVEDNPELKQEIMAHYRTLMPNKADYLGGLPSKLNRKGLDEVSAKYIPQTAPDGGAPTPLRPSGGQQIKFGGKIYNSVDELPPEGKAKYLAKTGGR